MLPFCLKQWGYMLNLTVLENGRILSWAVQRTSRALFQRPVIAVKDWQVVLTFINFIYHLHFAMMSYYIPEKVNKRGIKSSVCILTCVSNFPYVFLSPLLFQFSLGRKTFVLWGLLAVTPFGCFVPDLGNDTRINSLIMKRIAPGQMVQQDCKQSFPLNEWIRGRKYIT